VSDWTRAEIEAAEEWVNCLYIREQKHFRIMEVLAVEQGEANILAERDEARRERDAAQQETRVYGEHCNQYRERTEAAEADAGWLAVAARITLDALNAGEGHDPDYAEPGCNTCAAAIRLRDALAAHDQRKGEAGG